MEKEEKQVSDLYAVLPHPEESKIWMLKKGEKWVLPHIRTDKDIWYAEYHKVSETLGQVLNVNVMPQHITASLETINQPELDIAPQFLRDLLNYET